MFHTHIKQNTNSKFVAWNKYPLPKDPIDKMFKINAGFSKVLQMVSQDTNKNRKHTTTRLFVVCLNVSTLCSVCYVFLNSVVNQQITMRIAEVYFSAVARGFLAADVFPAAFSYFASLACSRCISLFLDSMSLSWLVMVVSIFSSSSFSMPP